MSGRSPKRLGGHTLAAVLVLAAALGLGACGRTATHEPADISSQYDSIRQDQFFGFTRSTGPPSAYDGSAYAKASYNGNTSLGRAAMGSYNWASGLADASYGAAFYLPPGTTTGAGPKQRHRFDILRWDAASAGVDHYGGIAVFEGDRKARLVRGHSNDTFNDSADAIGSPFALKEGCWNWLMVRQKFSDKPAGDPEHAINEVYLNGEKVVDSSAPNNYGQYGTRASFGLYTDAMEQHAPIDVYVDNSYASIIRTLVPPGPNSCDPPRGRYSSTPVPTQVPDGGSGPVPKINAIALHGEDKVYVGGDFDSVGTRVGAFTSLAQTGGLPDLAYPEVAGSDSSGSPAVEVRASAPDGLGGWFIGGEFTSVGGYPRANLAHIRADGTVDPAWDPGASGGSVYALANDGQDLYVGGSFTHVGGVTRNGLAKLNPTNAAVGGWAPYPYPRLVRAIALDESKLYVGGDFDYIGGQQRRRVAELDKTLATATSWNPNVGPESGSISAIATSLGSVYLGGTFTSVGGQPRSNIAQVDSTFGQAAPWNPNSNGSVDALVASGTRIYAGGAFSQVGGATRNGIAALDAASGAPQSWNPSAPSGARVRSITVSGATVYAGGDFTTIGGQARGKIAALDLSSAGATSWNPNLGNSVKTIGLYGGRVFAGGRFRAANVVERHNLAELSDTTGVPTGWSPDPNGRVNAIELAEGKLYVGGAFSSIAGSTRQNLAAFMQDTGGLVDWSPQASEVRALASAVGRIYVGSASLSHGGVSSSNAGAFSIDTGDLLSWTPGLSSELVGQVNAIEASADTVYLAGHFNKNGEPSQDIRELWSVTTVTGGGAWTPPCNGAVTSMALSGNTLYVGGSFTSIAGATRAGLASLQGQTVTSWNPSPDGPVDAIDADPAGVFVGGRFSQIAGVQRNGLAGLDPQSGLAFPLAPNVSATGSPVAIRDLDADRERLLVGGDFTAVGGAAQAGLARLDNPGLLTQPDDGTRTRRRITVRAKAQAAGFDKIALWFSKTGTEGQWSPVPAGQLKNDLNQSVASPVGLSGGLSPTLVWDAATTTGLTGYDGPVYVRALFTGGGGGSYTSDAIRFTLDRKAPATKDAVESIGPGSVDLLTGNFSMSADDVSIDAYNADLNFSRTYNSRDPNGGGDGQLTRENDHGGALGFGWTASLPSDAMNSSYSRLETGWKTFTDTYEDEYGDPVTVSERYEQATITASDGTKFSFLNLEGEWQPEEGSEDLLLKRPSPNQFKVTDLENVTTVFTSQDATNVYPVTAIQPPGSADTITYGYGLVDGKYKIDRAYAAGSSASECPDASPAVKCRFLRFNYNTTAQIGSIEFYSYAGWRTVAQYSYENDRLIEAWDGRITPPLKARYSYDSAGHITQVTPAGEEPFTINHAAAGGDPNTGRLASVSRACLCSQGTSTWTMDYNVAVSGSGAPYDMSPGAVDDWAQQAVPTDAIAILPPDASAGQYSKATIHYLDRLGREVNVASPGAAITTAEYDGFDNVKRTLGATNRLRALATGSSSAVTAQQLDTQNTYTPDGVDLLETLGPLHQVKLDNGQLVQARAHSTTEYDKAPDGSALPRTPTGERYHLPTKQTAGARIPGEASDRDVRVTKTSYQDQGDLGLTLRQPTSTTVDPEGLNLRSDVRYYGNGLVMWSRTPGPGGDVNTMRTVYYNADPFSQLAGCMGHAEWRWLPCKSLPEAQPNTPGVPNLPQTTTEYNSLYQPTRATDQVGNDQKVAISAYDAAGRPRTQSVSGTQGTSLDQVQTDYDPNTGRPTTTRIFVQTGNEQTITRQYDSLGRQTHYTDADGTTSQTTYDLLGRPKTVNDGKDTQTYSYDPVTGLVTGLTDFAAGTFAATYDADGNQLTETLPNGLTARTFYDESGSPTRLCYMTGSGQCGAAGTGTQLDEGVTESIHGQWRTHDSSLSSQSYTYDAAGRLSLVADTPSGQGCTTRTYSFDADSNRTRQVSRGPNAQCQTAGEGQAIDHTYDAADRITDAGFQYDAFGRITTTPATAAGGDQLSATYYTNDLVRSLTQAGKTQTFTLDPNRRPRIKQSTGKPDETMHYSDDSDSPSWTDSGNNEWQRMIGGIGGDLGAIQDSQDGVKFQLTNLHGDVIAIASVTATILDTFESDEFGVPRPEEPLAPPTDTRYGWLGGKERQTQFASGAITMGARVYVPQMGRFLQTDPVPGGSDNAYDYAGQDPVNSFDLDGSKSRKKKRVTSRTTGCGQTQAWCQGAARWARRDVRRYLRRVDRRRRAGASGLSARKIAKKVGQVAKRAVRNYAILGPIPVAGPALAVGLTAYQSLPEDAKAPVRRCAYVAGVPMALSIMARNPYGIAASAWGCVVAATGPPR